MVYFKLLLNDKRPKSDNIYPIVIRITYERNNTTLNTGIRVRQDYWDSNLQSIKYSHPNAQLLNKSIVDFNSKVQNASLQLINENLFSFEALKEKLIDNNSTIRPIKVNGFKVFADNLIEQMLSINKAGNAIIYKTATNRLMGYANKSSLKFTDITYTFLDGFKNQLVKENVRPNSISNYFRTIRAIYNKAIKAKLVDRKYYPFLEITVKTEKTAKRAIDITDVAKIYNCIYKPNTPKWSARNYFLLSFSLRGASFTDLAYLTPNNILKARLLYKRRKTSSQLNIKLIPLLKISLRNMNY